MKYPLITAIASIFIAASTLGFALVEVDYNNADNFRDIEVEGREAHDRFAREIAEYLNSLSGEHLPPDSTLAITFTQVDLAGAFEPWRGPDFHNIRIYKDIYLPRLEFNYQLVADDGTVLKEGSARISDINYLMKANPIKAEDDDFYYEKELLKSWIKRELSKF